MVHHNPTGFYTEEIKENNIRRGFALIGPDSTKAILSHVNIVSPARVGKYGVDIPAFEKFLERLNLPAADNRTIIIDEIGKMECFSPLFCRIITGLLASDKIVIATIALKGTPFIENLKKSSEIPILEVTRANRDNMPETILSRLQL